MRNAFKRLHLLGVREIAHFHEGLGAHHRTDRHRIGRIEHLTRLIRRQESIDLRLRWHVNTLVGVGKNEAVHAHHDGQREFLGQLEGLNVQIERLLIGLGKQLYPAAIALRERVGMIVPDIDRCADSTIRHRHDDRQPQT